MDEFKLTQLDPTQLADWQIAEAAEKHMKPVIQLAQEWGIHQDELLPYGHYLGKVDFPSIIKRLEGHPNGKYIDVTAITPTPLGEGKSTTTMGLVEGLGKRGLTVSGAIRQPSGGPTLTSRAVLPEGGWRNASPWRLFRSG